MATVEVTFTPLPAHVRTARLVATAVARRSGVDELLRGEGRLAVGEACSAAVAATENGIHDGAGQDGAGEDGIGYEAIGHDGGSAFPAGFGLAVISGLAEAVRGLSTGS